MKRSSERFLTTHTGSLPRPPDLIRMMFAREEGVPVDAAALAARIGVAVDEVVQRQVGAGLDVVNDGEMSKVGYGTYVGGIVGLSFADRDLFGYGRPLTTSIEIS